MSTEPERPIQKQLESFANKRRAEIGAPFELHPATRNLLQAEVARRGLKSPRQGRFLSQILIGLWPRVAIGGSAFVVLMLCTWMFFQVRDKPFEPLKSAANGPATQPLDAIAANGIPPTSVVTVAQVDARTETASTDPIETSQIGKDIEAKQFAARSASRTLASERNRADSTGQNDALQSAPVAAAQLADAKTAETPEPFSDGVALKPSLAQPQPATKRPATAKAPTGSSSPTSLLRSVVPSAPTFSADKKGDSSVGVTQRFAQLAPLAERRNASRPAVANAVLSSFQMEQVGDQVRVIDKDGSTYAGYLQVTAAGSRQAQVAGEKASAPKRETKAKTLNVAPFEKLEYTTGTGTNQDYYFRVVGTNRSLNQNVIFSGHLLSNTRFAELSKTNVNGPAPGRLKLPTSNQVLPPLLNSRISGTALVGERDTVEVQALPVLPNRE